MYCCGRFRLCRRNVSHLAHDSFGISDCLVLFVGKHSEYLTCESGLLAICHPQQSAQLLGVHVSVHRPLKQVIVQQEPIFKCLIAIRYLYSAGLSHCYCTIEIVIRKIILVEYYPALVVVPTFLPFFFPYPKSFLYKPDRIDTLSDSLNVG